jgi:multimeric flavodoxin WrbA
MKVIAINGSPKKNGNTFQSLNIIGEELNEGGVDFEVIHIGHKLIHGCIGCGKCFVSKNEECNFKDDDVNKWIQQIKTADGIILASPVYYSGIAGTMKCFLDRLFYVSGANGNMFRHKVGAAMVAVRRTGGSSTLDSLYHYLTYAEMFLATGNYWNVIHGRLPGEVSQDHEGAQTLRVLGKNMLYLLKIKEVSSGKVETPVLEKKEITNFIR